jgi:hypothetical protein
MATTGCASCSAERTESHRGQSGKAVWRNDNTEPFGSSVPNEIPTTAATSFGAGLPSSGTGAQEMGQLLHSIKFLCRFVCIALGLSVSAR